MDDFDELRAEVRAELAELGEVLDEYEQTLAAVDETLDENHLDGDPGGAQLGQSAAD